MPLRPASESGHDHGVRADSEFAAALRDLVAEYRPRRVLETGTHRGEGTTRVIAGAMSRAGCWGDFVSIESDPDLASSARRFLSGNGWPVQVDTGLSLPRSLLPAEAEIAAELAELAPLGVWADYGDADRAACYAAEVPAVCRDDLMGAQLAAWRGRADLVLLDSAGHLGLREFRYLLPRLRGPCRVALDDTDHVKHCRSLAEAKRDSRFRVLRESPERFGFAILEFRP